uniref:Uncharacterized protein n=1 Tax=Anguilla anguilla TaxID=7936 RepID=A0A0E9WCP9_ANGAN
MTSHRVTLPLEKVKHCHFYKTGTPSRYKDCLMSLFFNPTIMIPQSILSAAHLLQKNGMMCVLS